MTNFRVVLLAESHRIMPPNAWSLQVSRADWICGLLLCSMGTFPCLSNIDYFALGRESKQARKESPLSQPVYTTETVEICDVLKL